MQYATLLLSKVIDANDPKALDRFDIQESDMPTEVERKVYRFIKNYAHQNRGQAPSYATVAAEIPEFGSEYVPNVTDTYEYLVRQVKDHSAKLALMDYLPKFVERFNKGEDAKKLLEDLRTTSENIIMRTDVRKKVGTDLKTVSEQFISEYNRRKIGKSFKVWKSKFSVIGHYTSGNMYVIYGKSGRGKSVTALEDAVEMAIQGANVLIWSMEMSWYEVWVRIFVSLSGRKGVTITEFEGMDLEAGFDADEIRNGQLSPEFETALFYFIDTVNEEIPGNIIVRSVDDLDFTDRSLRALEADILTTKADVVVIDPFYYLDYERNTSKTAGGDAAETSKKLRRLTGTYEIVTLAITQADETKESRDEDGNRELELPAREDVKKTKQLLEDAYMLIAVDTDYKQGRGLVGINKGRDGGEGTHSEIIYIPQVGVVREMEISEFDF